MRVVLLLISSLAIIPGSYSKEPEIPAAVAAPAVQNTPEVAPKAQNEVADTKVPSAHLEGKPVASEIPTKVKPVASEPVYVAVPFPRPVIKPLRRVAPRPFRTFGRRAVPVPAVVARSPAAPVVVAVQPEAREFVETERQYYGTGGGYYNPYSYGYGNYGYNDYGGTYLGSTGYGSDGYYMGAAGYGGYGGYGGGYDYYPSSSDMYFRSL